MDSETRMDRRTALKWMLTAAGALSLPTLGAPAVAPAAHGYGRDPNLMEVYKPGQLWPLTFTPEQHATVSALCDVILPADERSPSASQLKVPDFIDEWVSAPYPRHRRDRAQVLAGLAWVNAESRKRFKKSFVELSEGEKQKVCDDICYAPKAKPKFREAASFFATFRSLSMSGFYTSPQGMKDIQYVGNVPLTKFDGPPPEVLAFLKLD